MYLAHAWLKACIDGYQAACNDMHFQRRLNLQRTTLLPGCCPSPTPFSEAVGSPRPLCRRATRAHEPDSTTWGWASGACSCSVATVPKSRRPYAQAMIQPPRNGDAHSAGRSWERVGSLEMVCVPSCFSANFALSTSKSGCTACVCCITATQIITANAGDRRGTASYTQAFESQAL